MHPVRFGGIHSRGFRVGELPGEAVHPLQQEHSVLNSTAFRESLRENHRPRPDLFEVFELRSFEPCGLFRGRGHDACPVDALIFAHAAIIRRMSYASTIARYVSFSAAFSRTSASPASAPRARASRTAARCRSFAAFARISFAVIGSVLMTLQPDNDFRSATTTDHGATLPSPT